MILSREVIFVSDESSVLMWYFWGSRVAETSFPKPSHLTVGTGRPVNVQDISAMEPTSPEPLVVPTDFGSANGQIDDGDTHVGSIIP